MKRPGWRALAPALILTVLQFGARRACADVPSLALVPVSSVASQGATIAIDALAVNGTHFQMSFPLAAQLKGTLSVNGQSWPVTLKTQEDVRSLIPAGSFRSIRYHVTLPSEAYGRAVLEVEEPDATPVQAVIDIVGNATSAATATPGAWSGDFQHQRLLGGRLTIHQPIYFISGTGTPPAKFQVSFKYRLAGIGAARGEPQPPYSFQFAYTQRSFWEYGPFYDNSYMPELMFQWLRPASETEDRSGFAFLGLQAGWLHESNGRSGNDERSANTLYVRPIMSFGSPDDWHVLVEPDLWFYFLGLEANRQLYLYRGNSSLTVTVEKGNGVSLGLTWLPGEHFALGSREIDLSVPVHLKPLFNFSTYLMVQYFDGYAETLINYQMHTSQLRAGIEFVR